MKIITVTPNPCLDIFLSGSEPLEAGALNRVTRLGEQYSGKGINVSRRLRELGTESVALTLEFSENPEMAEALRAEGLNLMTVSVPGRLRQNTELIDGRGVRTEINEYGSEVPEEKTAELVALFKSELNTPGEKLCVISGSIARGMEPEIYRRLVKIAKNSGAYTVADCDGKSLLKALEATPNLIKPNRYELSALSGTELDGSGETVRIDAVRAALELYRNEETGVLCTLDCDGAAFAGPDGSFMCGAVSGSGIKSFKGAGDAFLASFLREHIVRGGDVAGAMIKASAETTAMLEKKL